MTRKTFFALGLSLPLLATVAGTFAVLACSTTATPGGDTDAAAASDTGTTPDLDGGTTDTGPTITDHKGNIFALNESFSAPKKVARYRAGAVFAIGAKPDEEVTSRTTFGPCVAESIKAATGSDGTNVSAGKLTITGGLDSIEIAPGTDGTYEAKTSTATALWKGGEKLTAKVEGAGVPAFEGTLTAPGLLAISMPSLSPVDAGDNLLSVNRAADLHVMWSGSSSGTVVIYFATTSASEVRTLTCRFSPAAGSGHITKEALATLIPGDGFFDMYVEEQVKPTVKDWDVSFTVSTSTNDGAGASMTGTARVK